MPIVFQVPLSLGNLCVYIKRRKRETITYFSQLVTFGVSGSLTRIKQTLSVLLVCMANLSKKNA